MAAGTEVVVIEGTGYRVEFDTTVDGYGTYTAVFGATAESGTYTVTVSANGSSASASLAVRAPGDAALRE